MTRTAVGGLLASLSIALLAAVAPASAAQAADTDELTIKVVANGSGCPAGGATVGRLTDRSSFTVNFDGYFAYSGSRGATADARRNCQFALQIPQQAGWTYAVESANFSGFSLLGDDVNGQLRTSYYFQSSATRVTGSHTFNGPFARTWNRSDSFDHDELVFAPCGAPRNLNINTELRVTSRAESAKFSGVFLNPKFTVRLAWSNCP